MSTSTRRGARSSQKEEAQVHDSTPAGDDSDWMTTGSDIKKDVAEDKAQRQQRAAESRVPRRFWLANKAGKHPTEKEIIILNRSTKEAMAVFEHEIWDATKRTTLYRASPKKWETDPLVEILGKEPSHVVYLSVLTLVEWEDSKGNKHPYSREIIGIKNAQFDQFWKILETAEENNGTLRGTCLTLKRDTSVQTSPKIGTPQTYDNGMIYDFISEEELIEEFGHEAITNDQNKVLIPENGLLEPYERSQIYASRPSAEALRKEFGGEAPLGDSSGEEEFQPRQQRGGGGSRPRRQRSELPAQEEASIPDGGEFEVDDSDNPFDDE